MHFLSEIEATFGFQILSTKNIFKRLEKTIDHHGREI